MQQLKLARMLPRYKINSSKELKGSEMKKGGNECMKKQSIP